MFKKFASVLVHFSDISRSSQVLFTAVSLVLEVDAEPPVDAVVLVRLLLRDGKLAEDGPVCDFEVVRTAVR